MKPDILINVNFFNIYKTHKQCAACVTFYDPSTEIIHTLGKEKIMFNISKETGSLIYDVKFVKHGVGICFNKSESKKWNGYSIESARSLWEALIEKDWEHYTSYTKKKIERTELENLPNYIRWLPYLK